MAKKTIEEIAQEEIIPEKTTEEVVVEENTVLPKVLPKAHKPWVFWLSGVAALLISIGLGYAAYYSYNKFVGVKSTDTKTVVSEKKPEVVPEIQWNQPTLITSLGIFAPKDINGFSREDEAKYYSVGKYLRGPNKDAEILLVSARYDGPGIYPGFYRFIRKDSKLSLLSKYSDELSEFDLLDRSKFVVDSSTILNGLDFPETFQGSNSKKTLYQDKTVNELFTLTDLRVMFTDAKLGNVYVKDVASGNTAGGSIFDKNGFYIQAPDGTVKVYYVKAGFIDSNNVANITWNTGAKNTATYAVGDTAGCGRRNYATVIPSNESKYKTQTVSGKTSTGETVSDNTTEADLQDFYNNKYQGDWVNDKYVKVSYAAFVAAHPLVFWTDPFGRLIQLENTTFIFVGGCGKPVIYLYPEKTTKVSVKLEPQGGFSKTEPAYGNGWNVIADAFSHLTDLATGKTYPYLFWEGFGNIYQKPDKGWSVKKEDVHGFLNEKLAALGLNNKEIADFEEFWEPKMTASPYYFVSFYGNREMNSIAPLQVSPEPDTTIRVLMDFTPLDKPIDVKGFNIKTPARKGFTLVEWGGVLR